MTTYRAHIDPLLTQSTHTSKHVCLHVSLLEYRRRWRRRRRRRRQQEDDDDDDKDDDDDEDDDDDDGPTTTTTTTTKEQQRRQRRRRQQQQRRRQQQQQQQQQHTGQLFTSGSATAVDGGRRWSVSAYRCRTSLRWSANPSDQPGWRTRSGP